MILENIGVIVDVLYLFVAVITFGIVYQSGLRAPDLTAPMLVVVSIFVAVLWIAIIPILVINKLMDK